ncbi:MAG: ADP-ribosylglycohydrolase family protein [Microlunatus sp.]|nr:ADP-ribosylglycohydrolase family protein [Microlunatus sp.]
MITNAQGRARDVLLGVLYGDCLGAPYEFRDGPLTGPIAVGPSTFGHPSGRGTDDTETTIAVAQGLINAARDHRSATEAIADRLLSWYQGNPPDVGGTTARGLIDFARNRNPRSGSTAPNSIANGSLMRSAPFALVIGDGTELAVDSSRTTHAHPDVLACVRTYLWVLQTVLDDERVDPAMINDVAGRDLDLHPGTDRAAIPFAGIGYAIYALDLAVWAATTATDFSGAIESIVRLGGDTDTNGAICGAVLAARFGFPDELAAKLDRSRVNELELLAGELVSIDSSMLSR